MFKKIVLSLLVLVFVSSCGITGKEVKPESSYVKKDIKINKLIIKNLLNKKLTDINIMIPETDAFIKIEFIARGRSAVINFNKKYKSQDRIILTYTVGTKYEKHIIRIPPVDKVDYSGYDLQIEILSFGTSIALK